MSGEIDQLVMQGKYHATGTVNLSALDNRVAKLESGEMTIGGKKTFSTAPLITGDVDKDNLDSAVNVKCVTEMISENAGFIAEG